MVPSRIAETAARALPRGPARRVAFGLAAATMALGAWGGALAQSQEGVAPQSAPRPAAREKASADGPRRPEEIPVFHQPAFYDELRRIGALFQRRDLDGVEQRLDALILRYPDLFALHQTRAVLMALRNRPGAALASLERAVELGLRDPDRLAAQQAFETLRNDPAFAALLERMEAPPPPEAVRPIPGPVPAKVANGKAPATQANALYLPGRGLLRFLFEFPDARPPGPVSVVEGHEPNLYDRGGKVAELLNEWYAQGKAAGHAGDLYDNLDRKHSDLPRGMFPQLAWVTYGEAARARNWDYAPKRPVDFGAPTLGNSSTARTAGPRWRSMSRMALTAPGGADELFRQYSSNQIYVYPEHKDHDPFWGDVFPANTPYLVTSQGSSGSDRKFLHALATAMAALPPDTKAFAVERGLLAPTLQMLLRWSQNHVSTLDSYLIGRAHPSVFDGSTINPIKIAHRAQHLRPETLPPMVRLAVEEEERPIRNIELFGEGLGEALFDTPSAIARIARGTERDRRMVVSAAETEDPNGRPLTFKWRLLRGDSDKVTITPLDDAGTRAEIVVSWHDRTTAPGRPELDSQRVDIGVFADNGALHSAPAFVSVLFPPRQKREYGEEGRVVSVRYDAPALQDRYADPVLFPERGWRDVYDYDDEGRPLGWTRTYADGTEEGFTRHGARVVTRDKRGRPLRAELMDYPVTGERNGKPLISPEPRGAFLLYEYEGPGDRYGWAAPVAGEGGGSIPGN